MVILHNILTKSTVKSRPNVLWCYKKDLGFSRFGADEGESEVVD